MSDLVLAPAGTPPFPPTANAPTPPSCSSCGGHAVIQWSRRATVAELDALANAAADRRLPAPLAQDTVIAVHACADHAIHIDRAAQVHAAACAAPHPDHLPACDCEPEPLPQPQELGGPTVTLPTGWTIPAPSTD